jgi:hypothetical protein
MQKMLGQTESGKALNNDGHLQKTPLSYMWYEISESRGADATPSSNTWKRVTL